MQQVNGSNVTVSGDLIVGGKDSVYEIGDTSRLSVSGSVKLVDDTNAFFHQKGGTVIIGSTFDAQGHSTNGLLDLGRATTYQMDGGVLDVATIQQTGQFVFNGGQLYVKQMLINTTPASTPTYIPAPPVVTSPATPVAAVAASGGGGGGGGGCSITPAGGFTLERGIVVIDQYSDWRLQGPNADLTVGQNSTGGSNGSFVQTGGNVNVDGSLVIGDGPGGKGNYAMSGGSLVVHGQMILGRNGGVGYFNQTGGAVTINGSITINDSASQASKFNIMAGSLTADALSIGAGGGPGELHLGADAFVHILHDVVIGPNGKVTGNGTFDTDGAHVINNGIIEPGNSPGFINITGDYQQGTTGILNMQLAGSTTGGVDYDQLRIDGNATLAGTLNLEFINAYAPHAGDTYSLIILSPGHTLTYDPASLNIEVTGLRDGWQYSFSYDQADNALMLRSLNDGMNPDAVPLPPAAAGGAVGLALLAARRWRGRSR